MSGEASQCTGRGKGKVRIGAGEGDGENRGAHCHLVRAPERARGGFCGPAAAAVGALRGRRRLERAGRARGGHLRRPRRVTSRTPPPRPASPRLAYSCSISVRRLASAAAPPTPPPPFSPSLPSLSQAAKPAHAKSLTPVRPARVGGRPRPCHHCVFRNPAPSGLPPPSAPLPPISPSLFRVSPVSSLRSESPLGASSESPPGVPRQGETRKSPPGPGEDSPSLARGGLGEERPMAFPGVPRQGAASPAPRPFEPRPNRPRMMRH